MSVGHFLCSNCGFWQLAHATPRGCPVCEDVRHSLPDDGFAFLTPAELPARTSTRWRAIGDDLIQFSCAPAVGIGPVGYLIRHPEGNLLFEAPAWYSEEALAVIEGAGGVRWAAASHPHAYGALWQIQQRFAPELCIQRDDLGWTQTLAVGWPFDEGLELLPGLTLLHTGGHFAGHAVLFHAGRRALFAGDLLKIHFVEGRVGGLSCHKGFNRRIPLTHAELRRYREVVAPLAIDELFTSFDHAPGIGTAAILRLFDARLAGRPSVEPLPI